MDLEAPRQREGSLGLKGRISQLVRSLRGLGQSGAQPFERLGQEDVIEAQDRRESGGAH